MIKADLHIHSTFSDGAASIPEIIKMAEAKGLDAIAITDHDTFSHLAQTPAHEKLRIIPGLEISAADNSSGRHVHIIGYNIEIPETVMKLTQPLLEARHRNTLRQIEVLKNHGFRIDINELKPAGGKYLYKQHVMEYLVLTGQADEMFGEFYKKTFKNKGICHFDIPYIDALVAVAAVREAGGPCRPSGPAAGIITELVRRGLAGLRSITLQQRVIKCHQECAKLPSLPPAGATITEIRAPGGGYGRLSFDESGVMELCQL